MIKKTQNTVINHTDISTERTQPAKIALKTVNEGNHTFQNKEALNSLETAFEAISFFNEDLEVGKRSDKLEPAPTAIDKLHNKKMWVIEGYKIWAGSYQHALQLLPLIQSF